MNYQLSSAKNSGMSIPGINIESLLIIASILFIPAAYVLAGVIFLTHSKEFSLKRIPLPLIYILWGTLVSDYRLISSLYGLLMALAAYAFYIFSACDLDYYNFKKIFYVVSIIAFALGIIQYCNPSFTIPLKWVDYKEYNLSKRVYSTFFNPNIFGFYINFIIILCAENLDFKKINPEWTLYFSGLTCLLLTYSRTSWLALIISLFISSCLDKKYIKHALFISVFIIGGNIFLKTGRISIANAVNDSSLHYRLELWRASLEIFRDNFLTGIGFGTLNKYAAAYSDIISPKIEHNHSLYLQILTETGVAGASICLCIASRAGKILFTKLKGSDSSPWLTALTVFSMTLVHGMADSVPLTPQIMMVLSLYGGLLNKKARGTVD